MAEETKTSETKEENSQPEQAAKTYSEEEYNALKAQLDKANETISGYKDMDIEGIKASVDEWKKKAEQAEADRAAFEYRTKLSDYVKSLKLKDDIYEQHVTKLLEEKELKFDGDKLIGGDDVVNAFRESHPDAFQTEQIPPKFSYKTGGTGTSLTGVEAAFMARNPGLKID